MSIEIGEQWIKTLGDAWEAKDTETYISLFSLDAKYYWTPFEVPNDGHNEIAQAFKDAVASQEGINFESQILSANENVFISRWWCSYTRIATQQLINLDGIMIVKLNEENLCSEFREWWHSDEFLELDE